MKKPKQQRVGVFMDVQNLYHSARNIYKTRVNFSEVLKEAIANRQLIRAFAYVIRTKSGEEKSFFEALADLGIEPRIKDLKEFAGGAKKGDWDVGLAIDAIRTSPNLDAIIIASGDSDFVPLISYLRNHGKRVEIIAFGKTTAAEVIEAADEFIDLDKNSNRFFLNKSFINDFKQIQKTRKNNLYYATTRIYN